MTTALRQVEATWGIRPERERIQIKRFTPFRNAAGTVRGFLDIQLPSGLIISGIKLMRGAQGADWLAMPAVKATDKDGNEITNRDGKPVWNNFVEFASPSIRTRFQQETLAALRRQHPELFRGDE